MTRQQFVTLFFIALLIFVFYQTLLLFSPFLELIFWAAILAYAFYPLHVYLKRLLRSHEALAALLMTLLILLIVAPPILFLIVNLASQAIDLYQLVTSYIREGRLENLIDRIRALPMTYHLEEGILQWEPIKQNATAWLLNSSKNIANFAITQAGTITKNVVIIILNAVLMFFLVFIFLKDGEKIYRFIYQAAPLEEENKSSIFNQINYTFAAVIRGQLLTSLTQSVIAGLVFWVLGLPAPIFLAAATFVATLIPFVGAVGVWLPLTIYLFAVQSYVQALVLFLFGALVISMIDNIIKPALIGKGTKLPYFLLFFGILGGISIYGILGVFLGPLILSLFFVLVKIYQEKFV